MMYLTKIFLGCDFKNKVYICFLINTPVEKAPFQPKSIDIFSPKKTLCCGYPLEAPCTEASNEYPHVFCRKIRKTFIWIHLLVLVELNVCLQGQMTQ